MSRVSGSVAGALFALTAAFVAVQGAAAAMVQNPAAVAEAAARAARQQTAVDSLITPAALRELQRLADSAKAASTASKDKTTKTAAARSTAPAPSNRSAAAKPPASKPRASEPVGPRTVTEIVIREREVRRELRLVTSTPVRAALSEPFRTADRARLFLTLDSATISEAAVGDAADITKEDALAALMVSERPTGVRMIIEVRELGRYGLETAGDTTIIWLRPLTPLNIAAADEGMPARAATDVGAARDAGAGEGIAIAGVAEAGAAGSNASGGTASTASRPGASAGSRPTAAEVARSGWTALRRDAATAAGAAGTFIVRAGEGTLDLGARAGEGVASGASRAAGWLAGAVPLGAIARFLILATLLLTPPAAVALVFRRRRTAAKSSTTNAANAAAPTPIAVERRWLRLGKSARPASTKPEKPRVTRRKEDARLWAARTMAANGTDAAEIARQTGISRDAALLLVRRTKHGD